VSTSRHADTTVAPAGVAVAADPATREEFDRAMQAELAQRVALLTSDEYTSTAPSFADLTVRDWQVLGALYVALPIVVAAIVFLF
jgi:hypothetical protein